MGKSMLKQGKQHLQRPWLEGSGMLWRKGQQGQSTCVFQLCTGLWLKSRCLLISSIFIFTLISIVRYSYLHLHTSTWDHILLPLVFVLVWGCWRQSVSCLLFQKHLYFTFFSQHIFQELYWHIIYTVNFIFLKCIFSRFYYIYGVVRLWT